MVRADNQARYDLVIRSGSIVDGTGAEPFWGDVAITGDTIVAMGQVDGRGHEEIDAAGCIVTPGFVDAHTHFDAQIGWDPMMTPVSLHGVTTALMGNCGITFAPCKPADREVLAGMMETVEDIPKQAILTGLPWNWDSYGGYLDAIEQMRPAINVAGLVGHCAVRFYVMGERAVDGQPTDDEKAQMVRLVDEAMSDGAVGFSTSRILGHILPDGRNIPGTFAEHDELVRIAAVVGKRDGLMQNVLNTQTELDSEIALLGKQAREAGARVLFSTGAGPNYDWGDRIDRGVMALRDEGLDISAVSIPRGSGSLTGLQCTLRIWRSRSWKALSDLELEGRLAAIRDPQTVAALVAEAEASEPKFPYDRIFWLGADSRPDYHGRPDMSLAALAAAAGEHPAQTFLRLSDESDGQALFLLRMFNSSMDALARVLSSDFVLPGLGDAGAHVGMVMDSGWGTFVLSHWHREVGLYSLPEAVRRITSEPARILGLTDRGRLAPGLRADINVIDLPVVHERMPQMRHDFPGGSPRFMQEAVGYKATLCNGQIIVRDDQLTGARAGEILRHRSRERATD